MQHHLFRWNSLPELADVERHFSSFLHNGLRTQPEVRNGQSQWTPAVDVSEDADGFLFTVELPGMKPESVVIELKDNVLTMKGERPHIEAKEGVRIHHRERPSGKFARVFRLEKPVNAEQVTATYRDGILEVRVPLRTEAKSRTVPVLGS